MHKFIMSVHLYMFCIASLQRVELSSKRVEEGGSVIVARLGIPNHEKRLPLGRTLWTCDLKGSRRGLHNPSINRYNNPHVLQVGFCHHFHNILFFGVTLYSIL